jgi:penicillin-binding protein 1A
MALGAGSVTPLQMATAYSVFANGGYLRAADADRRWSDKGRVLREAPPHADESRCARWKRATPS